MSLKFKLFRNVGSRSDLQSGLRIWSFHASNQMRSLKSSDCSLPDLSVPAFDNDSPRPIPAPIQIQKFSSHYKYASASGPLAAKTGALWGSVRLTGWHAKCSLPATQCEKNAVRPKFSFFASYNLDIQCILCIIVNNEADCGVIGGQYWGARAGYRCPQPSPCHSHYLAT